MQQQKTQSPQKSSAECSALYEKSAAEHTALVAELDRLKQDESAAARAGVDALRKNRSDQNDVAVRRDVAAANAEYFKELRDQAIEREQAQVRAGDYTKNQKDGERWHREVVAFYEQTMPQALELHARGKRIHEERVRINSDLPDGSEPLPYIEEWRCRSGVPDREEIVEVERRVRPDHWVHSVPGDSEKWPLQKFKEQRVVPGTRGIQPYPLWETFQAAGLEPGDPDFVVPGVRIEPLR